MWSTQHYPASLAFGVMSAAAIHIGRDRLFIDLGTGARWSPGGGTRANVAVELLRPDQIVAAESALTSRGIEYPASHRWRTDISEIIRPLLDPEPVDELLDALEYQLGVLVAATYATADGQSTYVPFYLGDFCRGLEWPNSPLSRVADAFKERRALKGRPWL